MAIEYGILTEPSSLSIHTNSWEMGWAFTIGDQEVHVVGLRVKFPVTQSTVGHLWSSDGTLLASCPITVNSVATWSEAYFTETVVLDAGKQYIISCYNSSSRYSSTVSAFTFSKYFASIQGGRYISGANNFPANSEANSMYPLIDVIINQRVNHVSSGNAEFSTDAIRDVSAVKTSYISWDADVPEGTTLNIYAKLTNGEYALCEKGGIIAGIDFGADLTRETLSLKVEMTTDDPILTPVLTSVRIQILDQSDVNAIVLIFDPGTPNSIQRAAGGVTVAYDGSGSLMGQGGPVLAFEHAFTPEGLDPKNNPNGMEFVNIGDITAISSLKAVDHKYVYNKNVIDIADITADASLIHIDDI